MRVSASLANYSWPGGPAELRRELGRIAGEAERAGVDTVWVPDHVIQADPTVPASDADMLEAYTTLGFLAARTERVRLGTMVTGATFRPPALLAKVVSTLDVLSGGRAWLGIGAGHQEEEARDMGLPLPSMRERFEELEETLEIVRRLWEGDESPFEGRHHRLAHPVDRPGPLGRPRILIGGHGERRTLPLVARHADACNLFDIPDGGRTVRHKLEVLARLCEEIDRPYAEIEKTLSARLEEGETSEAFAARCARAAAWGIDHIVVVRSRAWTTDALATLAGAITRLERVTAADGSEVRTSGHRL
jgi:F420-dependent oxidoreductase-like protein